MTETKIIRKLVELAAEFFNISADEVIERINKKEENLNRDWYNRKSIKDFYKTTENYVFDLIHYNDMDRIRECVYPIMNAKDLDILDFGAGIGEISMMFASQNKVYYYDIGEVTSKFAKFVSEKTNRPLIFLENEEDMKSRKYDVILTLDVLEHLENPMETVKMLKGLLKPGGSFLSTALYVDFSKTKEYPMHLSENEQYVRVFEQYINTHFNLVFYHHTSKGNVCVWTLKDENI